MKIKIIYKKLGRERNWGESTDGTIIIDPRAKGKKRLEILIHESLHVLFPSKDEDYIIKSSITLTNLLWNEGYRLIDNDNSQHLQDGSK